MKSPTPSIAAILTAVIFAPAFAAEFERAPELPDLSTFQRSLHEVPAPAAAPATIVGQAAKAGCPVLDLNGATIGRGWFSSSYEVKINDKAVGTVGSDGDGYAIKDSRGNVIARSIPASKAWGSKSEVVDCSGAKIG